LEPGLPVVPLAAVERRSRRRKRRVRSAVPVAAVLLAVGLAACGGDDDDDAVSAEATVAPGPTAKAGGSDAAKAGAGAAALPRVARFAGLDITFEALDAEPAGASTPASFLLRTTVHNTYVDTVVYLTPLVVELDVGGETLRGAPAGGPGWVQPGADIPADFRFALSDPAAELPDASGAVVRLSNRGDEPLAVPLRGGDDRGPPEAAVEPPPEVAVDAAGLVFSFASGSVTLDLPTELANNVDTSALRAAEGSAFVRLLGTVTGRCPTGCPGGVLATSGIARLVVDGSATPPATLSFNQVLVDGQRLDVELVFEVRRGAGTYVLRFETSAGEAVDVPIEVPALDEP
jgi:hypothetical protein